MCRTMCGRNRPSGKCELTFQRIGDDYGKDKQIISCIMGRKTSNPETILYSYYWKMML